MLPFLWFLPRRQPTGVLITTTTTASARSSSMTLLQVRHTPLHLLCSLSSHYPSSSIPSSSSPLDSKLIPLHRFTHSPLIALTHRRPPRHLCRRGWPGMVGEGEAEGSDADSRFRGKIVKGEAGRRGRKRKVVEVWAHSGWRDETEVEVR